MKDQDKVGKMIRLSIGFAIASIFFALIAIAAAGLAIYEQTQLPSIPDATTADVVCEEVTP